MDAAGLLTLHAARGCRLTRPCEARALIMMTMIALCSLAGLAQANASPCPAPLDEPELRAQRQAALVGRDASLEAPLRQAQAATALIVTASGERASGVNVSRQGLVLTALHAVQDQGPLWVSLGRGGCYQAQLVRQDASRGLALLSIKAPGSLPAVALRQAPLAPGEAVFTVGSSKRPQGSRFAVHAGQARRVRPGQLVGYDAWTDYGYGGGPVVDAQGALVAMHTSWEPSSRMRLGVGAASLRAWLAEESARPASEPASAPASSAWPLLAEHDAQLEQALAAMDGRAGLSAYERQVAQAIRRVHGASVRVGSGSGVLLSQDGLLLTAYHVVDHALDGEHRVTLSDGRALRARVVAHDAKDDLALLRVQGSPRGLPWASLAAAAPPVGSRVILVGQPGQGSGRGPWHTSQGKILGYPAMRGTLGDLAYDAWTYWGHSGCPVFDERGQLVGLHNSWDSRNAWRHGLSHGRIVAFLRRAQVMR